MEINEESVTVRAEGEIKVRGEKLFLEYSGIELDLLFGHVEGQIQSNLYLTVPFPLNTA